MRKYRFLLILLALIFMTGCSVKSGDISKEDKGKLNGDTEKISTQQAQTTDKETVRDGPYYAVECAYLSLDAEDVVKCIPDAYRLDYEIEQNDWLLQLTGSADEGGEATNPDDEEKIANETIVQIRQAIGIDLNLTPRITDEEDGSRSFVYVQQYEGTDLMSRWDLDDLTEEMEKHPVHGAKIELCVDAGKINDVYMEGLLDFGDVIQEYDPDVFMDETEIIQESIDAFDTYWAAMTQAGDREGEPEIDRADIIYMPYVDKDGFRIIPVYIVTIRQKILQDDWEIEYIYDAQTGLLYHRG